MKPVVIIGAGLAGCEAAWQVAKRGGRVTLYEMKPEVYSPAHRLPFFAEVVCSNSFKSESLGSASGVLKAEMKGCDSLILKAAEETRVPAGESLAVDRVAFSSLITHTLENLENVKIIRKEVTMIPEWGITILATGPLTSEALSSEIKKLTGQHHLFFYDAISPIVTAESINFDRAFRASRYGKGGDDYINCPMEREEYYRFVDAVNGAERIPVRDFEKKYLFEGCLPVEELADRGKDTLSFGPLKPVGLIDPRTGRQPFAVVQLRQEDRGGTLFNLVGFQTRLRQEEQRSVFQMIPGLERAEFVRWGSVHRNTFIDSPRLLKGTLQLKDHLNLFFAGQITGVEGYMESTAMGLLAGINVYREAKGLALVVPPRATAIGALVNHLLDSQTIPFQPMNVNFGLFPPCHLKGAKKRLSQARRALEELDRWKLENGI